MQMTPKAAPDGAAFRVSAPPFPERKAFVLRGHGGLIPDICDDAARLALPTACSDWAARKAFPVLIVFDKLEIITKSAVQGSGWRSRPSMTGSGCATIAQ